MKTIELKWISSEGGPLVLIPEKRRNEWGGSLTRKVEKGKTYPFPKDAMNPKVTHYGEVCDKDDIIVLCKIDTIPTIILGDSPTPTCWMENDKGGILIRQEYANDTKGLKNIWDKIKKVEWETEFNLTIEDENWVLFDATEMGQNLKDKEELGARGYTVEGRSQDIFLPKGKYKVSSFGFEPDEHSLFILHKFEKQ